MEEEQFIYRIEVDSNSLTLFLDGVLQFTAKIKQVFFKEAYRIVEEETGKKCELKVFKRNLFYYGEEKIELYDDNKVLVMKLSYDFGKSLFLSKPFITEINKNISLSPTDVRFGLLYVDENQLEFTGEISTCFHNTKF